MEAPSSLRHALWFVAVAVIWGSTNPFLKRGSLGIEKIKQHHIALQLFAELQFMILNWRYSVPFLANLSGSLLYYYTLARADISLSVPITNSLTFLVTTLVGRLLGERIRSVWTYIGTILVVCGVAMCVASKLQ